LRENQGSSAGGILSGAGRLFRAAHVSYAVTGAKGEVAGYDVTLTVKSAPRLQQFPSSRPLSPTSSDFEGGFRYEIDKPAGIPRKLLDASRLTALGRQPKIELRQGLLDAYNWYVQHATKTA